MSNQIDGKFIIQQGDGISHAIVKELGLSADDAKKLDRSIWTQIFTELSNGNTNNKIYRGGNEGFTNFSNNFKVRAGQVVEISTGIWNKIVNIVETAINKTLIPKEEKVVEPERKLEPEKLNVNLKSATLMELDVLKPTTTYDYTQANIDINSINFQLPLTEEEENLNEKKNKISDLNNELNVLLEQNPVNKTDIMTKLDEMCKDPAMLAYFMQGYNTSRNPVCELITEFPSKATAVLQIYADKLGIDITETKFTDSSLNHAHELACMICDKLNENVDKAKRTQYQDIKTVFNNANMVLVDAANMDPKPNIAELSDGSKVIRLDNGQKILVKYTDGEISEVDISYDTTPDNANGTEIDDYEVSYTAESAQYDNDHSNYKFEGSIKKEKSNECTYDFEAIKKVAEKIFDEQQ